jgi:O-antigen ligase
VGHALCLPISIAISQPLAYLLVPLAAWLWWRRELPRPSAHPLRWPILLFVLLAVVSAFVGLRPALSVSKLDRLLLLGVVFILPVWAAAAGSGDRLAGKLVMLFLVGCTLQAAADFVRIPLEFAQETRAYQAMVDAGTATKGLHQPTLFDMGNMRDPQFYMVALCLITGLLMYRRPGWSRRWLTAAALINGVAWVVHFKRGSWISLILAVILVALLSGRRWIILVVVAVVAAVAPLPQVQHRIDQLMQEEVKVKTGGRTALWTRVGPELIRAHPWGMGWRATRNEDFQGHGVKVQKKLNHLHNNPLQVLLETGWAGLVAWLVWMGAALTVMWRGYRWARARDPDWAGVSLGVFGGFTALMINGMVEYNFGDGEVFMLMNLLMAWAAFTWAKRGRDQTPASPA